jgi:acyl carrier protein
VPWGAQPAKPRTLNSNEEAGMDVEGKVKKIISEQLMIDEDEITPGATFEDDLGADSLDIVELVMQFEEVFDLEIPDDEAEKMVKVKDAVDYVTSKVK